MLANDSEQRLIRKALFVMTNCGGRVDAGQNCGLARSALRPTVDAQTRVSANQDAIERNLWILTLKDCERLSIAQSIERIVRAACTDAQTVDEEEQNICH